jgi:hypothetical protein
MQYTGHARERMDERGISEADVEWAVAGGRMRWTADGTRLFDRWYTAGNGRRYGIYVVLDPLADWVVTVWWEAG